MENSKEIVHAHFMTCVSFKHWGHISKHTEERGQVPGKYGLSVLTSDLLIPLSLLAGAKITTPKI